MIAMHKRASMLPWSQGRCGRVTPAPSRSWCVGTRDRSAPSYAACCAKTRHWQMTLRRRPSVGAAMFVVCQILRIPNVRAKTASSQDSVIVRVRTDTGLEGAEPACYRVAEMIFDSQEELEHGEHSAHGASVGEHPQLGQQPPVGHDGRQGAT